MSKMYLLSGLENAQKNALKAAGIEWTDWDGETISITHEELGKTLKVLGAQASEKTTDYNDVMRLVLTFRQPGETNRRPRGLTEAQRKSRENYVAACSERIAGQLKAAQKELAASWEVLPSVEEGFVFARRKSLFAEGAQNLGQLKKQFRQELVNLRQVPKVVDVRVVPGAIHIYTEKLCATDRDTGELHELGKFLIVIHTDGRDYGVRWFNGTRRVDAFRAQMNAPNVYGDGTACADALIATIFELIASCQFASLADLAIQFVEEVTDDEYSRYIAKWPKVTP